MGTKPRPTVKASKGSAGVTGIQGLTIGEHISAVSPELANSPRAPSWPPDAFAIAASLLQVGDAYKRVAYDWPPNGRSRTRWVSQVERVALDWRRAAGRGRPAPKVVDSWWRTIQRARGLPALGVGESDPIWQSLVSLCSAADEASGGAGIVGQGRALDPFEVAALRVLVQDQGFGSTLCRDIHPSRLAVLPRMHTPQSGLTIRSLSHQLGLVETSEVVPRWGIWPIRQPDRRDRLNILLLPWPLSMRPDCFKESAGPRLPKRFGWFTTANIPSVSVTQVRRALASAEAVVGRVDLIIFPECALRVGDVEKLATVLQRAVIGGTGTPAARGKAGTNAVVAAIPFPPAPVRWSQGKHHRWKLTPLQLGQYALGERLSTSCSWWEHISLDERRDITFLCADRNLTFCVLICEDLARQDPVASVVRSVGPDLVIALLMDGPQLGGRWPARYAGVLADDPGSSVLTLTSLGMARLSCSTGFPECRVVSMWKDAEGPIRELSLFQGAVGIALCLKGSVREEFTADGRTDRRTANYLALDQVHQIYVP